MFKFSATRMVPVVQRARRRGLARDACFAAGLAAGMIVGRVLGRPSRRTMPHLQTFRRALATTRGEVAAAVLAARVQTRYDALFAERPRFVHPALRTHLTYQILPGLALYQILKEDATQRGAEPATALAEASKAIERMDVLARWLPLLQRVPFAFWFFRSITPLTLLLFPPAGWDIEMVEDSAQRIAFNVRRCFYVDVLTAYGAPELTASFCRLDDVAYAALPPGIRWERSTTIGRGGAACDFCWRAVRADPHRLPAQASAGSQPSIMDTSSRRRPYRSARR